MGRAIPASPAVVATDFANDPLNLLAVDGSLNLEKAYRDAVSWLRPKVAFRCPR